MADDHQDRFVGVPVTLNALLHADYRSSYLEVYLAIRSFASLSPASDNFARCFPNIDSIGDKFGHTRTTVCEAIAWLETNRYLYRQRRRRNSSLYTLILRRDWFIQLQQTEGLEHAKKLYETWLEEHRARSRSRNPDLLARFQEHTPTSAALKSDGRDIKTPLSGSRSLEVPQSRTSRGLPSEKSSPADPDLDPEVLRPLTRETPDLDVGGKAPTPLPLPRPFFQRKGSLDLDPRLTPEEWDRRWAEAKAKADRMLEEEAAKKKGGG